MFSAVSGNSTKTLNLKDSLAKLLLGLGHTQAKLYPKETELELRVVVSAHCQLLSGAAR